MEGSWLGLYPKDKLAEDANSVTGGVGIRGDHTGAQHRLEGGGGCGLRAGGFRRRSGGEETADVFWGGYSGYFADPDGHLWEVAWNPFMDLT